jgi:hypothetical protein
VIKIIGLVWAFLLLGLAACQPQAVIITPTVLETPTPTPSLTPTHTPVWFPATDTPTAQPSLTLQPTQDARPGIGATILLDDFSSGGWQILTNEAGRAAFGKKEFTLAVKTPKGVISSLRAAPLPGNNYLEITATPSLCKGADTFGLYLRAASPGDGYRLLATCAGELRLERLKNKELVVLQDWTPGVGLVPGGMLPVRLGVWAAGKELRFFVNNIYQFTTRDPVWTEGQLGVYARSAGDTPLTVSFSDLLVKSLDPARIPTATLQPTPKP